MTLHDVASGPGSDQNGAGRRLLIRGSTDIIAHLGDPIAPIKAPMVLNPWFEHCAIDAVVTPMGVRAADYARVLPALFRLTNIRGALVTMPHKMTTARMLDTPSAAVTIAGSCNAVRRNADGAMAGDLFDGAGFVRGAIGKGVRIEGTQAIVVGSGGVGRAIAVALAAAGVARLKLFDIEAAMAQELANRLVAHYSRLRVECGSPDPSGSHIVVNATPLGMRDNDPLPVDVTRIDAGAFVGEVVMTQQLTPLLRAAHARGCSIQVGTDMLFEQLPLYLAFFGFPATTSEQLRAVARLA